MCVSQLWEIEINFAIEMVFGGKKKKKKRNGVRSGGEVLVQPTESGQTGPACRLVSAPGFCVAKWVCGDEDFWGVWKVPAISFSILIPAPKGPL